MKIKIKNLILYAILFIVCIAVGYYYFEGWYFWITYHPPISDALEATDPIGWFFFRPLEKAGAGPLQVVLWFFGSVAIIGTVILSIIVWFWDKVINDREIQLNIPWK